MPITFTAARAVPDALDVLAVPVFKGGTVVDGAPAELDTAFLAARGFTGKPCETLALMAEDGSTILAVGVGPADKVTAETIRKASAAVVKAAGTASHVVTGLLAALPEGVDPAVAAQAIAEGTILAAYQFVNYKSESKPCTVEQVTVLGRGARLQGALDRGVTIAEAVCWARDLVNEPAGTKTPAHLAKLAAEIAERDGLTARILDEKAIVKERLGGLLGVAAGSSQPPRLIQLTYEPGGRPRGTLALVGKGITFDSGGLSLKTGDGMMTMKTDMSGGAAVLATMSVLKALGCKSRVIGIVPATENMPSGTAIKPGDVLRARNGKTMEVLNTDAEGRLVLADGLCLAVEEQPDAIVDIATLTGAQVVALGKKVAALMSNSDGLTGQLQESAERTGEQLWPLPLTEDYRSHLDSEVADLKNIGNPGQAGTIVAGIFLQEFVDGVPWAHLDVAGPSRADGDDGYWRKGGTAFGTRTLIDLALNFRRP